MACIVSALTSDSVFAASALRTLPSAISNSQSSTYKSNCVQVRLKAGFFKEAILSQPVQCSTSQNWSTSDEASLPGFAGIQAYCYWTDPLRHSPGWKRSRSDLKHHLQCPTLDHGQKGGELSVWLACWSSWVSELAEMWTFSRIVASLRHLQGFSSKAKGAKVLTQVLIENEYVVLRLMSFVIFLFSICKSQMLCFCDQLFRLLVALANSNGDFDHATLFDLWTSTIQKLAQAMHGDARSMRFIERFLIGALDEQALSDCRAFFPSVCQLYPTWALNYFHLWNKQSSIFKFQNLWDSADFRVWKTRLLIAYSAEVWSKMHQCGEITHAVLCPKKNNI